MILISVHQFTIPVNTLLESLTSSRHDISSASLMKDFHKIVDFLTRDIFQECSDSGVKQVKTEIII